MGQNVTWSMDIGTNFQGCVTVYVILFSSWYWPLVVAVFGHTVFIHNIPQTHGREWWMRFYELWVQSMKRRSRARDCFLTKNSSTVECALSCTAGYLYNSTNFEMGFETLCFSFRLFNLQMHWNKQVNTQCCKLQLRPHYPSLNLGPLLYPNPTKQPGFLF